MLATRTIEEPLAAPEADGLAVEVVDAASGAPCPDALVLSFWGHEEWHFGHELLDDATLLAKCNAQQRTDGDGRTRVVRRGPADSLVALAGERWGAARLDPESASPLRIAVAKACTLAVEVVDATGRAAPGMKVQIGRLQPKEGARTRLIQRFASWCDTTSNAAGHARFRGVEFMPAGRAGDEFAVVVTPPLGPQVVVTLPLPLRNDETARVELGAVGRLVVRLVDGDGQLWPVDTSGLLMPIGEGMASGALAEFTVEMGASAPLEVGIGLRVAAFVMPPGHFQKKAEGAGPTKAGETVVLDIVVPSTRTLALHGSVVTDDGKPWSGPLDLRWMIPTIASGRWENPTHGTVADVDGGFDALIAESAFEFGPPTVQLVAKDPGGFERRSERLTLPAPGRDGTIDLGEGIVVHGGAFFVEGLVVDAKGAPVPGVMVMSSLKPAVKGDPRDEVLDSMRFSNAADGRFRFAAASADDEFDLSAHGSVAGWQAWGRVHCKAGDHEVRLVMTQQGAIAGHALVPDGLPRQSLYVSVREPRSRTSDKPTYYNSLNLVAEPDFQLPADPGRFDVIVHSYSDRVPYFEALDVEVVPGEITRDPRLQGIDLRGVIRVLEISVVDPDGGLVKGGSARVYEAGRMTVPLHTSSLDGKAVSLLTRSPVDLLVEARGFRTQVVRGVTDDCVVTLERGVGAEVTLHFRHLPPLRDGERFFVRFERVGTPLDRSEWPASRIANDGRCQFTSDDPGDYRFVVLRNFEEGGPADRRVRTEPSEFTIPADPASTALEIEVEAFE